MAILRNGTSGEPVKRLQAKLGVETDGGWWSGAPSLSSAFGGGSWTQLWSCTLPNTASWFRGWR